MEINVGAGTLYGTKQAAPQHFNSDYSSPFHSSIKPYNARLTEQILLAAFLEQKW